MPFSSATTLSPNASVTLSAGSVSSGAAGTPASGFAFGGGCFFLAATAEREAKGDDDEQAAHAARILRRTARVARTRPLTSPHQLADTQSCAPRRPSSSS